jgi:hypothetical protein
MSDAPASLSVSAYFVSVDEDLLLVRIDSTDLFVYMAGLVFR